MLTNVGSNGIELNLNLPCTGMRDSIYTDLRMPSLMSSTCYTEFQKLILLLGQILVSSYVKQQKKN